MLVDLAPIHRAIQPLASPPALPSAALSALERRTRELHRPGDSVAICVRRDLIPGQILVGLIVGEIYVALTVDAAEDTALKLHDLVVRLLFADAPSPRPSAHAAALEALAVQPSRPVPRARGRK